VARPPPPKGSRGRVWTRFHFNGENLRAPTRVSPIHRPTSFESFKGVRRCSAPTGRIGATLPPSAPFTVKNTKTQKRPWHHCGRARQTQLRVRPATVTFLNRTRDVRCVGGLAGRILPSVCRSVIEFSQRPDTNFCGGSRSAQRTVDRFAMEAV
jgi:hypothetical protein